MKKRLKIWVKAVSYFFNFRKPVFREFNCIDMVAGNKLLFLMAWDMENAGRIAVNPGGHVYKPPSGAVIIALLPATTSVDITIRNCWRRELIKIHLKHVSLDKESFDWLISDVRMFNRIAIADIQPERLNYLPELKLSEPILQLFYCQADINPLFNYQNLNRK